MSLASWVSRITLKQRLVIKILWLSFKGDRGILLARGVIVHSSTHEPAGTPVVTLVTASRGLEWTAGHTYECDRADRVAPEECDHVRRRVRRNLRPKPRRKVFLRHHVPAEAADDQERITLQPAVPEGVGVRPAARQLVPGADRAVRVVVDREVERELEH